MITLCNVLFSNILFTGKVMALSCSILGTYYIILEHDASLVLTLFFGSLSIQAIAFYTVSCQKLFGIPLIFGNFTEQFELLLNKACNVMAPRERKILKYRIKVIPKIGIKDGGFRVLQSESTLLFIHFYLNTVISLLLLYGRSFTFSGYIRCSINLVCNFIGLQILKILEYVRKMVNWMSSHY